VGVEVQRQRAGTSLEQVGGVDEVVVDTRSGLKRGAGVTVREGKVKCPDIRRDEEFGKSLEGS